jgi:beta-galactosidase
MGYRKPADFANGIIEWTLEYAEGEVMVIGLRGGKAVCSHILKTAGEAKQILLAQDRTNLVSGGDIAHVEVSIADNGKTLCPHAEVLISFALTGDGAILGACSADLNSDCGFTSPNVMTSGGKALVMVKTGASSGTLELTAYGENFKPTSVRFKVS